MTRHVRTGLKPIVIVAVIALLPHVFAPPARSAGTVTVTIDAGKKREPINRYIYAQFIEHLGRCIYGGIWAEMLEDRKFYFPITPDYDPYRASRGVAKDARFPVVGASPWEITGGDNTVTMVKEDSFVGDHTPLLAAGGGIRQNDLPLVKGKRYTGRIRLKAPGGVATVTVTLSAAAEPVTIIAGDTYKKYPLAFTAKTSTSEGSLEIAAAGGKCLVGTVSLMPADNIKGMRADTLAVLKELNAPMYRWPGGNFVSGYDWRDGIGDRDRRPPRGNPAWTGVEHNDMGIAEFIAFCREVDAEPLVVVNTGFGDPHSAAREVEYCNGSAKTAGGGRRARDGYPEPFDVTWWGVGNEMFGGWQLGYMALNQYVLKHNRTEKKMRAVDPDIKTIAVGRVGEWSETMLRRCADHMDLISEHFYCRKQHDDVAKHIAQIPGRIRKIAAEHRQYRKDIPGLAEKNITIAMDEWNYWYRPYEYGELGCIYRLRDALGIAAGFHEYYRNTDIITMAQYAQTVNVIGAVKTTGTAAAFATTGLAQKLYGNHYGTTPVAVEGDTGKLDIAAALTADGTALTVGIINPLGEKHAVAIVPKGITLADRAERWTIGGPEPTSYNEPGKTPAVTLERKKDVAIGGGLDAGPVTVNLYTIPLE